MQGLEKERENRYRSAGEMERAVTAVLDSWRTGRERQERETVALASQAQREGVEPPSPEHKKSRTTVLCSRELSRRWRIAYVIAAAALVLVGIGSFVARSLTEKTAQVVREQKASVESLPRGPAPPLQPAGRKNEELLRETYQRRSRRTIVFSNLAHKQARSRRPRPRYASACRPKRRNRPAQPRLLSACERE